MREEILPVPPKSRMVGLFFEEDMFDVGLLAMLLELRESATLNILGCFPVHIVVAL